MLVKKPETKEFERLEAGIYDAVCYMVCDLGTQSIGIDPEGNEMFKRRLRLGFELIDTFMLDARPFVASKEYTASLHEKSQLTKDLISWRGKNFTNEELKGFDLQNLLGVPCQLQIIEKTNEKTNKTFSVIQNILPKNKNFKFEKLYNEILNFELDNFDIIIFDKLYPFLKEKIKNSPEYKNLYNEEIPF